MKKLLTLLLAIAMIFGLVACGSKKTEEKKEEQPTQDGTAVATEKEAFLLSLVGTYTDGQTGKTRLSVSPVNEGAEGVEMTITQSVTASQEDSWIMVAKPTEDLSKLEYTSCLHRSTTYDDSGKAGDPTTVYVDGTGYFTYDKSNLIWHSNVKDEVTDIVFVKDAKQDTGTSDLTDEELNALVGDYTDSVSQRATLNIAKGEGKSLVFTIHWGSSADEATEWKMTGTYDPATYHFDYANGVKTNIKTVDGKETKEEVYNNGTGYFSIEGGALTWHTNMANDHSADQDLVFNKNA